MPNLRSGNRNGQTYEGSDQSDNDQLEQDMADNAADALTAGFLDMVIVTDGAAGGAAGGAVVGAAGGALGGVVVVAAGNHFDEITTGSEAAGWLVNSFKFKGIFTFENVFMTPHYEHMYDLAKFKKFITTKKILGVDGTLIYSDRVNTSEMSKLFSKFYDQYSYVFAKYVNRKNSQNSAEILKGRADAFHTYLFHYKTIATPVAGGSCDFQNFRNKIVIPTMLVAYNSNYPITMLPGIMGNAVLQRNYFRHPNPLEMEAFKVNHLQLGA